jgi:hypothetical protein
VRPIDSFLVVKCHVWVLPQCLQDPGVDGRGSKLHLSFAKADEHSPLCHLSSHFSLQCEVFQFLDTSPSRYRLSSISGLIAISHTTEIRWGDNLNVEMRQTSFRDLEIALKSQNCADTIPSIGICQHVNTLNTDTLLNLNPHLKRSQGLKLLNLKIAVIVYCLRACCLGLTLIKILTSFSTYGIHVISQVISHLNSS